MVSKVELGSVLPVYEIGAVVGLLGTVGTFRDQPPVFLEFDVGFPASQAVRSKSESFEYGRRISPDGILLAEKGVLDRDDRTVDRAYGEYPTSARMLKLLLYISEVLLGPELYACIVCVRGALAA